MGYIDCTHPLESGMPVYPESQPVSLSTTGTVASDGAKTTGITLESHVGTHVDAPSHMEPEGPTLDAYDVSDWVFDALVIDCTEITDREPITTAVLPDPTDHDLLCFRTDWSKHWGTDRYWDHPYLSADVAEWCAQHDYSVGIDAFSPDPTPSVDPDRHNDTEPDGFPAHDALFDANQRIVENLTNLAALPATCELHVQPLPIRGGDGSPVRAVAHTSD